jgi:hypothetical protein
VPHEAAPWSVHVPRGSAAPAGAAAQRPIEEGSAQLLHAPAQASLQQMPSTQKLLAHSLAAAHACPFGFGPQLPATQAWPGWQSSSIVQLVVHDVPLQRYGQQF